MMEALTYESVLQKYIGNQLILIVRTKVWASKIQGPNSNFKLLGLNRKQQHNASNIEHCYNLVLFFLKMKSQREEGLRGFERSTSNSNWSIKSYLLERPCHFASREPTQVSSLLTRWTFRVLSCYLQYQKSCTIWVHFT